jgi:hypothetical protein
MGVLLSSRKAVYPSFLLLEIGFSSGDSDANAV